MPGRRSTAHALRRGLAGVAAVVVLLPAPLLAGTTGKISGRVVDGKQAPIVAATVAVVGQPYGAFTGAQGQYNVLNVPPGTYEVRISRVGFRPLVVLAVVVSADNTTRLDATLEEAPLATEPVVVTATRPPVDVNLTSSLATLQSEEIALLPVQELQDVVNLQAGVVSGHFRGGRIGEVQYQVDGVSVNNAYDNTASVKVDRSLLQEVQVISGTFDAEYGQAMSGVVNAVLKDGTEKQQVEAEAYTGGFVFPGREQQRLVADEFQPAAARNVTLTVSGSLGFPKTTYLANVRRYEFDDYVRGWRTFETTPTLYVDPQDSTQRYLIPTFGDGEEMALGFSREWSGALKITNRSIPNVKLSYQGLFNRTDSRRINYSFLHDPDGLPEQRTVSVAHGFDATCTLGKATFVEIAIRQNYFDYFDRVYDDVFDAGYDLAGPAYELPAIPGLVIWGVDFTRFEQTTNTYLFKSSLTSQVTAVQQVKAGVELQIPEVRFGTPGYLVYTQTGQNVEGHALQRYLDLPPDYPAVQRYWPVLGAAFLQDRLEWRDFTLRAGVRLDYFDARASLPSDLANPANAIAGAPLSLPRRASPKLYVSPRLGVAYPITDRTGVHFAYGHNVQFPVIRDIFRNADYSILARLQATTSSYQRVMGNPDIEPEQTVQYEFGFKQALTDDFGVEVNAFYKDIRELLGVEFVDTYNDATYARITNADFGNVRGFTIAVNHHRLGPASVALDYTWQLAQGNSSDPYETATRAQAHEDPRPRVIPFDWDQRHTLNMIVSLAKPDIWSASAILRVASGQPYTPNIEQAFGTGLERNAGRKPTGAVVDLRAERGFRWGGRRLALFGRVFNLLDARFFNGAVFATTGSPYYSRFPGPERPQLGNPTRFYAPRRIEVGLTWRTGS